MHLKRVLSMGITPCPNDAFMFHALANGVIDLSPYGLSMTVAGVERLNLLCSSGELDVAKVSARALPQVLDDYVMIRSGAAIAWGCGPMVVTADEMSPESLRGLSLAVPGRMSTASFLLELHGGHRGARVEMEYDLIMDAVARGEVEAGLLTHEGRFTYREKGLHVLLDLGQWWERRTSLPLCLGAMVAKRSLGMETIERIERAVRDSIVAAQENPGLSRPSLDLHCGRMERNLVDAFISSYVNEFSLDIGEQGETAVLVLLDEAYSMRNRNFPEAGILTPVSS